jgi:hypothetical protein
MTNTAATDTGLRHPPPGLTQRERGLFGLVLAISGAVVRTAGSCVPPAFS